MAKFKGKNLSLLFDGTEEFNAEGTQVVLDNEEGDDDAITFADFSAGETRQWFFQLTATSDYGADSFWTLLWENAGQEIAFLFKPYGNATATTAQPHFSGTCTVIAKPPIGGTAGETFTFEARLDVEGEPLRVTA